MFADSLRLGWLFLVKLHRNRDAGRLNIQEPRMVLVHRCQYWPSSSAGELMYPLRVAAVIAM